MAIETFASFLDDPPPYHQKLAGYGARPYWSPDGKRIAFVDKTFGDVSEIDLATRLIRQLTHENGDHHWFLRVLFLPNGDYLLVGPAAYRDDHTSRHVESELWLMDGAAAHPPYRLGLAFFEGLAVSATMNRIAFAVNQNHDPDLADDEYQIRVADIVYTQGRAALTNVTMVKRFVADGWVEPQDFRRDDSEIIFAHYRGFAHDQDKLRLADDWRTETRGIVIKTGELCEYIREANTHNECEGIFPDQQHICLESSCDFENQFPPIDLWKLRLDGSGARVRMTRSIDSPPWRASNSNVSPDGKWLAFMVNTRTDGSGTAKGLGLLDLAAWEKSEAGSAWEYPAPL